MSTFLAEVFYIDETHSELVIHSDNPIPHYKLVKIEALGDQKEEVLGSSNKEKQIFHLKHLKNELPFFLLEFENGESISVGYRILPIPGMYNFRDMGGYPAPNNRKVAWKKIYRGDHLFNLNENGIEFTESLGLKSIIDFRSKKEIEQFPNPIIKTTNVNVNLNPEGNIAVFAGSLQNNEEFHGMDTLKKRLENDKTIDKKESITAMINQQENFVDNPQSIQAFSRTLKVLANPQNSPAYIHCKGGKDRTGFAAMLLLGLLGVSEEHILYDYMLTKKAREKKNKIYYQRFFNMTKSTRIADYLFSLFDTREEYILAAYRKIIISHGSIKNYCLKELDLSTYEIENLEKIYLEPFMI